MNIQHMNSCDNGEISQLVQYCNKRKRQLFEDAISNGTIIDRANYRLINREPNLACGILYMANGNKNKYIAHSGVNSIVSLSYLSNISPDVIATSHPMVFGREQIFNTKKLNSKCSGEGTTYDRNIDTEAKIIEFIAYEFGQEIENENQKWNLVLWTYLYPCPSCRCVARAFEIIYSNIEITIIYEKRDLENPCDEGEDCDGNI